MKRVAGGIYLLEAAAPANAFLIEGSADLTLVDAGPEDKAAALLLELQDNGFRPRDVQRSIVTHAHPGHAGALAPLLREHRFKVYAHPFDIPVLTGRETPAPARAGFLGSLRRRAPSWKAVDIALSVETGQSVRGLPQWQVLHLPGHTPGSIGLYHPVRQVLLCGDALVRGADGALALPTYRQDPAAARATLAVLAKVDCDILCCGHGAVLRGGAFRFVDKLNRETA
ncbi:MAG: MBL fold metallo-hydrolase [Elusimicrobiota bacterium]|jgi:glyoxylase-like metal-dependent hydrolase (beta-lactamase superfamily II)